MALPTTFKGARVAIYLETATPGIFARPCGLTSHEITFSKGMNETNVADCDDPDLPAWVTRDVENLSITVTGSGALAAEAIATWQAAAYSTNPVNARVYIGLPTDTVNGKYFAGLFHLTEWGITGERGQQAQVSVTLVSSGGITYNDIP
jgi:hypothetical protein